MVASVWSIIMSYCITTHRLYTLFFLVRRRQLVRICGWSCRSFVILLPAINEGRSEGGACWQGIAEKTKTNPFEGSLPIDQIDWHGNSSVFCLTFSCRGSKKKLKLHLASNTPCRLCAAASSPAPFLQCSQQECVCMCEWTSAAYFTMTWWRTWTIIKAIHTRKETDVTVERSSTAAVESLKPQ